MHQMAISPKVSKSQYYTVIATDRSDCWKSFPPWLTFCYYTRTIQNFTVKSPKYFPDNDIPPDNLHLKLKNHSNLYII